MQHNSLSKVPVGRRVRIVSINGGRQLVLKLRALGISSGNELEVLHHRRGGIVVGRDGNRVALGLGVAEKLIIEEAEE